MIHVDQRPGVGHRLGDVDGRRVIAILFLASLMAATGYFFYRSAW